MKLGENEAAVLRILRRSAEPLSGRKVASIVDVAANTANKVLRGLEASGLVTSERVGKAVLWTTTADVSLVESLAEAQQRTVLVVTAVEKEAVEVRNRLVNTERVRVDGLPLTKGEVLGKDLTWTVYVAQSGMGNSPAAALVARAADKVTASVVAFVGSAAGLKPDDQQRGDVVVASRIHTPYPGKQVAADSGSELLGRDKSYSVPAVLVRMVEAAIVDSAWTPTKANESFDNKHPHAFVAPVVAVESVQTDPDAELMKVVRARYQDSAALDMESHGLATGADAHDLPVLVVRGISDFMADKTASGDEEWQAQAVGNAASLLFHILRFAQPEDFQRVAGSPPPASPPPVTEVGAVRDVLPRGVRAWLDRLARRSPARAAQAESAIREMRSAGTTAASALSPFLHRPPSWLREDDTGDGWALIANLASVAGSTIAWRAFDRAAEAAALTGDVGAQAYFRLLSALNVLREEDGHATRASEAEARERLEGVPSEIRDAAEPLFEFYRVALLAEDDPDLVGKVQAAESVFTWLGIEVNSSVVKPRPGSFSPHPFDAELRSIVGSMVLHQTARWFLAPEAADKFGVRAGLSVRGAKGNPVLRDLADEARLLAQQAVQLRPQSEAGRLMEAQAILGALLAVAGRPQDQPEWEFAAKAREVELTALEVRDTYRDWHGESGTALAVAGRARSMQGDPAGALRMLLGPPEGMATQEEAKHPDVVRVAAFTAMELGRDELAIELASRTADPVEAQLMKATVYGSRAGMSREATASLLAALDLASGQVHEMYRALNGLTRRFGQLSDAEKDLVARGIEAVAVRDPELGSLLNARVALETGKPEQALEIVRGLEENALSLMTRAEALTDLGRAEDAWRVLFEAGCTHSGLELLMVALSLASQKDLSEPMRTTARALLNRGVVGGAKVRVLNVLRGAERADGNWAEVLSLTNRIAEESAEHSLPIPEEDRWIRAEALYFLGAFARSATELAADASVQFNHREKVMLFFSALAQGLDEKRAAPTSESTHISLEGPLFSLFIRAAREWVHDEGIANFAMGILLASGEETFSDLEVMQLRRYWEEYFERYGDGESPAVRRIDVGENFEELERYLREQDSEQRRSHLEALVKHVQESTMPLVALPLVTGRSYAEVLLRGGIGCYIAVADDGGVGVETARAAINGQISVDTSALVVGALSGIPLNQLISKFDSVGFAEPLKADLARARSASTVHSVGTLGYDSQNNRPYYSEYSPEELDRYRDAVNELWSSSQRLRVARLEADDERATMLAAFQHAREAGVPLWADDAAMRAMARGSGVAAFGTLDLVCAFADEPAIAATISTLRNNRVVDLPIVEQWAKLAADVGWDRASGFAMCLSRPYAWRDLAESFAQFRGMVRTRPEDLEDGVLANWAYLAGTGLAMATQPHARARVVAALLACVIFEADPIFSAEYIASRALGRGEVPQDAGSISRLLLEVADDLRARHFPDGDPLGSMVETLSAVVSKTAGAQVAGRVLAEVAGALGDPYGERVFSAYLSRSGT